VKDKEERGKIEELKVTSKGRKHVEREKLSSVVDPKLFFSDSDPDSDPALTSIVKSELFMKNTFELHIISTSQKLHNSTFLDSDCL
jgi:hypothetical protein